MSSLCQIPPISLRAISLSPKTWGRERKGLPQSPLECLQFYPEKPVKHSEILETGGQKHFIRMTFPSGSGGMEREKLGILYAEARGPGLTKALSRLKRLPLPAQPAVPSPGRTLSLSANCCAGVCRRGSCLLPVYSFSPTEGNFLGNRTSHPTGPPCCLSCLQMTHCFL